MYGWGLPPPC